MNILHKIKLLLGLEKPPAPVHVPTLWEQLQAQLQPLTPDQKAVLLNTKQVEATQAVDAFVQAGIPSEQVADPTIWQQCEVLVHVYEQQHPQTPGVVDSDYEALLGKLVLVLLVSAQPAAEVLSRIESYVQRFEEPLLLHEASGMYKFTVSENKKVIRFPFMEPKAVKAARKEEAEKELSQLFTESRELQLLELDTHTPWIPISFLEITDLARGGAIACVKVAGKSEYYGFLK